MVKIISHFKLWIRQLSSIVVLPSVIKKCIAINSFGKKARGRISIILLYEHIGDIIACEPVSRFLKRDNSGVVWVVCKKYLELPKMFRAVDMVLPVNSLSEMVYLQALLTKYDIYNLHFDGRFCRKFYLTLHNKDKKYSYENYFEYGSILETFSEVAGLPRLKDCPHLSLQNEDRFPEIKSGFVSIQVDSNESCKMWDLKRWEQLIQMNPNLLFVEIGLKSHFCHLANCNTSFCGKLSLSDIAYLMRKSMLFIGIDSCGAHYANALNVPGIILLGSYHGFSQYNPYSVTPLSFKILYRPNVNEITVNEVQREVIDLTRN